MLIDKVLGIWSNKALLREAIIMLVRIDTGERIHKHFIPGGIEGLKRVVYSLWRVTLLGGSDDCILSSGKIIVYLGKLA